MGGIDASMMMSLGTCRLVMPRSELTIARAGPASYTAWMSASIAARWSSGRPAIFPRRSPKPLLTSTPRSSSVAACFAKTSSKKTRTAWPKMIGSETFIIVAFKCSENNTPVLLALASCSLRKSISARLLMNVASRISSGSSSRPSRSTVVLPSAATNSIRTSEAFASVSDFSLCLKSPRTMVATCVLEFSGQAPMRCGFCRAYCLTALGARRSELPSRSTGLTALPLSLS